MKPETSPFQTAWMSFDLGEVRPCEGTYCFYGYESLPPIPDENTFAGKFEWLKLEPSIIASIHAQTADDTLSARLTNVKAEAERLGIVLPQGFELFMSNPQMRNSIPSCTACYFDLSENFIPAPIEEGGYFLRFMNDQQDVLLWYLYFAPSGEHCILVSNIYFDDIEYLNSLPAEAIKNSSGYCAPTFETFLYRIWLENTIWFSLSDTTQLGDAQQKYLAHYQN